MSTITDVQKCPVPLGYTQTLEEVMEKCGKK